jgi:hypothetical protein
MKLPSALLLASVGLCAPLLAGCDMLGLESPQAATARKEAEGKAVGSACRHAGRAIEDCYVLNKKADKSAVFAGWREMNDYMRENKIEEVKPELPPPALAKAATAASAASAAEGDEAEAKTAEKGDKGDKSGAEKHAKNEAGPGAKKAH